MTALKRGWTGLPRGTASWNPTTREQILNARKRPLDERFNKFVVRQDGCWGWSGCNNGVGYGYLRVEKKLRLATHVSLELDGRPRPSDSHIACHRCDNPICTNPEHLWWGTPSENMHDCSTKGRRKSGGLRTVCLKGHALTPDNTIETKLPDGRIGRRCKICRRASLAARSKS